MSSIHESQAWSGGTGRAASRERTKRISDILLATVLTILFAPFMVLVALATRSDGGPALFCHERIGRGGAPFKCWKFRTMRIDADRVLRDLLEADSAARDEWSRNFKLRDDPRVTLVGRFLRQSSLDELPQLFNVLRGEMALVGPRPIIAAEIPRYGGYIEDYYRCRPGITGLWQVSGRNNVSYAERVALDVEYCSNMSVWRDCLILAKTVFVVITQHGAY
jgi:undecaprenyl-phosphate galactose phosphotransferase